MTKEEFLSLKPGAIFALPDKSNAWEVINLYAATLTVEHKCVRCNSPQYIGLTRNSHFSNMLPNLIIESMPPEVIQTSQQVNVSPSKEEAKEETEGDKLMKFFFNKK